MVALTQARKLDFADTSTEDARTEIREVLADEPKAARRVYAALAHKAWSLLVERRFDAEIRDWHGLLHQVKTYIRSDDVAAAERISALADLLRESISFAETSPAREVARRPNARRILEMLAKENGLVPRQKLLDTLGMRTANLSNVLTQLVAHNLVERRDKGREAEFRLTRFGRQLFENDGEPVTKSAPQALANDVDLLGKLLGTSKGEIQHKNAGIELGYLTSLPLPKGWHGTISIGDPEQDSFMYTDIFHVTACPTPASLPVHIDYRHGRSPSASLPSATR